MKLIRLGTFFALAMLIPCCASQAQSPQLKDGNATGHAQTLAEASRREITPGSKLTVVTVAQPTLRQACRVEAFDGEELVCKAKASATTYHERDLVAIIKQDQDFNAFSLKHFLSTLGLGGGALAGAAILVASSAIAAIPLAVIGSILILDGIFEMQSTFSGKPRERLLFMNPDQRLQVAVK